MKEPSLVIRSSVALILVSLLTVGGCSTKHIVRPVSSDLSSQARGTFYALPRTVVLIDIPVTRLKRSRSLLVAAHKNGQIEALRDAAYHLGIPADKVFEQEHPEVSFKLGEPTIHVRSEPDPDKVYYVELAGGFFKDRNFAFQLSEAGMISSADSRIEDKSLAFTVKTVEAAASIVGKVLTSFLDLDRRSERERVTAQILEIRKRRLSLISGAPWPSTATVPSSILTVSGVDTLDRMLKELDNAEAELIRNFTGNIQSKTTTLRFEVRPKEDQVGTQIPLFAFSKKGGISAVTTDCACVTNPILPQIFFIENEERHNVSLLLDWDPPREEQMWKKVAVPTGGERSYYYRVPGIALARLTVEDPAMKQELPEIGRKRLAIAQLGTTISLPATMAGGSSRFNPVFYVESGAIKELRIEGKAPDISAVSSFGSAAGTILDAFTEREKAAKEDKDELSLLKRQADILEQRERIRELEKNLLQ